MSKINWHLLGAIVVLGSLIIAIYAAHAKNLGQWENSDPVIKNWYQHLMQPDNPSTSCCGEADAWWADSFKVKDGKYIAIITDTRPDEPLRRRHIDVGTEIEVPNNKLVDATKQQNPTGHGIIFLSTSDYVWCFVAPGGV